MMKTFLSAFALIFGAVHGASIGLVTGLLNIRKILKGALFAILATFLLAVVFNLGQAANAGGSFMDVIVNILRTTLVLAIPAIIIGIITVLISRLFLKDTAVSKP